MEEIVSIQGYPALVVFLLYSTDKPSVQVNICPQKAFYRRPTLLSMKQDAQQWEGGNSSTDMAKEQHRSLSVKLQFRKNRMKQGYGKETAHDSKRPGQMVKEDHSRQTYKFSQIHFRERHTC